MNYVEHLQQLVQKVNLAYYPPERIIGLIDLTRLEKNDADETIINLCQRAQVQENTVAAICVYPEYIPLVKAHRPSDTIKIATVANFPHGSGELGNVTHTIGSALKAGADEVDVVLPYQRIIKGEYRAVLRFLEACKQAAGDHILKVILESGALQTQAHIEEACRVAIDAGCDFLKTSTGKIQTGATLDAAATILLTIRDYPCVGFKVSGGIRSHTDAARYIYLAEKVMGRDWVDSQHFRIGASSLLDQLVSSAKTD